MKNRINIYSNEKIKNFLKAFLGEYDLIFLPLDEIDYKLQNSQSNIIIINNNIDFDLINFKNLNDNFLIISSLKIKNLNFYKNIKLLISPKSIRNIKNTIENFLQNLKLQFHDICIDNDKLTNINNKSFCYLTKAEQEILCFLIKEKETSKNFIKEQVLKIKSNIETNSLESHLTRIRRKMNKVKTNVKIQTKSEKLLIIV